MEIASTALGGVSLAVQLSLCCLKGNDLRVVGLGVGAISTDSERDSVGYEVIKSALEASKDSCTLSNQFEIEQLRLQNFVKAAGLAGGEDENRGSQTVDGAGGNRGSQTLRANTMLLLNILSEINLALEMFARNEPHQKGLPNEYVHPTISTNVSEGYSTLLNMISTVLRNTRVLRGDS
ncbi:hypothetical protein EPUS_07274 [Endocarpon pusillum Z07020]|uniref:Uncharacterized protein n=1 Tax=Endocarpon pusillum (strain Z07020 / HMAS-L-300199) TaxID=1263415 RepID=U1HKI0_ENDPU|nr:uncharacterized protein EPUS_07274 [Endocarpon pusillum Z07020]ERF69459.1 hypothetical protein EPUS_07274 [Endocarpon pusillum Z07020]